jgi:fatty acid CoA ligase FadD32
MSHAAITVVSSGRPLRGYEVRCDGAAGEVGAVAVRGPSIGTDALSGASFAGLDGWMSTGDLGMMLDGWLYVFGRGDDYLVARGRNIYAPAVEDAIGHLAAIRAGRVAAVGLPTGEWVIAAETVSNAATETHEVGAVLREIRQTAIAVADCSPTNVVLVDRGRLPFTSSGKLQRREVTRRYLNGELEVIGGVLER